MYLPQVLAQLPQASLRQSSAILSSIEFDRDAQFFATAGVSKRISIYDFAAVLANPWSDVHCPALELGTRSKLSCLSWHRYVKSQIISSDYEGAPHRVPGLSLLSFLSIIRFPLLPTVHAGMLRRGICRTRVIAVLRDTRA